MSRSESNGLKQSLGDKMAEFKGTGAKILQRLKELQDVRRDYETGMWEDIARFVNPRREDISQYSTYTKKGQHRGKDVYDGTPLGALNVWADGMQGFLVSESLNWFRSEMSNAVLNEVDEVREWLQEYDRIMYSAFRRSNFYAVVGEWFRDAGSIGTATLYTEEDIKHGRSVHICIHPREVFIAENKFQEVDTVYREFEITARQAVQMFDEKKLSKHILDNAKNHPSKMHKFVHATFPNDDIWVGKKTYRGKEFKSCYVEKEASGDKQLGNIVKEGGYDINPYAVWRFRKNSDEVYGYSPAADGLTEVFSLNQIGKTMIKAAQKSVDPPLNVPEHMRGHVRMSPHGYNYYDKNKDVITPIQTGINYPIGIDQQERLQRSLEEKYRVNFFQLLTRMDVGKQRKTAEEVRMMKAEQAVLMGPQVDRLYSEGLKKVFEIVSDIEDKAGNLPPAPDVVYEFGGNINITLTGPLAQSQKELFKIQPIQNGINTLAPMAQLWPNLLDRIDEDEMAEEILETTAFPQKFIRTDEEVAKIREERAKQQQAQMQMQMALEMADKVPKLSKKVEEGSPLEAVANA
jgi:hypothetical protein